MCRPGGRTTAEQLDQGLPVFIDQLGRTLDADAARDGEASLRISGGPEGDGGRSEIGRGAAANGAQLMSPGFDVEAVVHCYGDLCQTLTDLASERAELFTIEDFRTLNRCLDNAIADAVAEFSALRDARVASRRSADERRRLGSLAHELRNALHTARLAYSALEAGALPMTGATSAVLGRSLAAIATLLETALSKARVPLTESGSEPAFSLADLVAEAAQAASLDAASRGCELRLEPVAPDLHVAGSRGQLLAALGNILGNAVKFTRHGTAVTLSARVDGERVAIEVADHCGGLPPGAASRMFKPFSQLGTDRSGLGLGLTIARANVEADGGQVSVRDLPGVGCVFAMQLPRRAPD